MYQITVHDRNYRPTWYTAHTDVRSHVCTNPRTTLSTPHLQTYTFAVRMLLIHVRRTARKPLQRYPPLSQLNPIHPIAPVWAQRIPKSLWDFYLEVLIILGVILQYRVSASFSCFLAIVCKGLKCFDKTIKSVKIDSIHLSNYDTGWHMNPDKPAGM